MSPLSPRTGCTPEVRVALAALPATTIVVALRRRRRRRASSQAWRYRTHHEASADSARIISARYQEGLGDAS